MTYPQQYTFPQQTSNAWTHKNTIVVLVLVVLMGVIAFFVGLVGGYRVGAEDTLECGLYSDYNGDLSYSYSGDAGACARLESLLGVDIR